MLKSIVKAFIQTRLLQSYEKDIKQFHQGALTITFFGDFSRHSIKPLKSIVPSKCFSVSDRLKFPGYFFRNQLMLTETGGLGHSSNNFCN